MQFQERLGDERKSAASAVCPREYRSDDVKKATGIKFRGVLRVFVCRARTKDDQVALKVEGVCEEKETSRRDVAPGENELVK